MKYLKTISQIGLLFSPFITFLAFANSYIPKAKFFEFSEFPEGSSEHKKMVYDVYKEIFIETFPWFLLFPAFLVAFLFIRKKMS